MESGDLYKIMRMKRVFTEETVQFYIAELIIGIQYLHKNLNIMYRDLKPENILISTDGHIKLTDFGLSKIMLDTSYTFAGTPEYLAPEIILNQGYNQKVDIWALGVLCYELLSGKVPFYDSLRNIDRI